MDDNDIGRLADTYVTQTVVRTLLVAVAKAVRPDDPREFVAQVQDAAMDTVKDGVSYPGASAAQNAALLMLIRNGIQDATGRINWPD